MRILMVTATYPPSVNGVAIQVKLLTQAYLKLGHQVAVVAPHHHRNQPARPEIIEYPALTNPFEDNYPLGIPQLVKKKALAFRPDIVHTHHPFFIGQFANDIAQIRHCPLVFTHHTQYQTYLEHYLPRGQKLGVKVLEKHLQKFTLRTTAVICPSQSVCRQLQALSIKNTIVIPNGIDTRLFRPRSRHNPLLHLIYVGRLSREKEPQKLLSLGVQIKKLLPQFTLSIVGAGHLSRSLDKSIGQKGLTKNVHLLGILPQTQLPKVLSRHHFFISYSPLETFSLSHLEALACGLPLIIPPRATLGDFVAPENSLYIPASYPEAAQIIVSAFRNPVSYQSLQHSAHQTALRYSLASTVSQYLDLYQQLLKVKV